MRTWAVLRRPISPQKKVGVGKWHKTSLEGENRGQRQVRFHLERSESWQQSHSVMAHLVSSQEVGESGDGSPENTWQSLLVSVRGWAWALFRGVEKKGGYKGLDCETQWVDRKWVKNKLQQSVWSWKRKRTLVEKLREGEWRVQLSYMAPLLIS